jgi:hypothetical protein
MSSRWNIERPNDGEPVNGPSWSMASGPNIARRRFIEIAVASPAGATLAGIPVAANAQAASPAERANQCDGSAGPGPVRDVIDYEELRHRHLASQPG